MAERRMFAKTIIDSDAFIDMPLSTQALYFHLGMREDDDGFINKPKKIVRMIGASEDDYKLLVAKNFVMPFDSGSIVIKHWKMHNYIPKDHYKPTVYTEEKAMLELKDNGVYTRCIQDVYRMDTQVSIGKSSIGKSRVGQVKEEAAPPKPTRHKYGMYELVLLTDEDYEKLKAEFPHDYSERIARLDEYIASTGKKYKNHLATIRSWARKDKPQQKQPKKSSSFLDLVEDDYD